MKALSIRRTLAAALLVAAALVGSVAAVAASPAPVPCGVTWGSLPRASGAPSPAALLDVRTGRHDCYDRVVFDFTGPADGYRVAYAAQVAGQGSGRPLGVNGGAKLDVVLLANASGIAFDDHLANVDGYRTLRDVVYGGSFEGYTTFGVGVRARLPFRVLTLSGPGSHSRLVIDVAHHW